MHSMSFGAEGDSNVEIVSVKILLKQAYTAHLAKVRSLECELRALKEQLLQSNERDKTECSQCKEIKKTLDSCKQEHLVALQEQQKKYDCLAEKLAHLENRNASMNVNTTAKQDAAKRSPKLQSESSCRKQVLKSINTNVCVLEVNCADKKSVQTEIDNAGNKSTELPMYQAEPLKNETATNIPSFDQKTFFSTLQESILDEPSDDSDIVLVTETLDIMDNVSNKVSNKKKKQGEKANNIKKAQSSGTSLKADVGKENIFGVKSPSSGKRNSTDASKDDKQIVKKCRSTNSKEKTAITDDKASEDVPTTSANVNININSSTDVANSMKNVENLSGFTVNPSFFDVDPSFLEQNTQSVTKNDKKSKMIIPAIGFPHDDDADFQTSIGTISKKENDDVGQWKTSKKNLKKSAGVRNVKTTSQFKMTLQAPSSNFKKRKYKQTKLSKSIFQSSHASGTDSVIPSEKVDVVEIRNGTNNSKSALEDNKGNWTGTSKLDGPNETLTWGEEILSNSEMENLKNMTIDMDATFVPDLVQPNSNDSVAGVSASSHTTKRPLGQNAAPGNICDNNISSDYPDEANNAGGLNDCFLLPTPEKASVSLADQQCNSYFVEQYPKNVSKPPIPKNSRQKCNSFDRVPSPEKPNYKFKENPVRSKDKRQQLKGFDCKECEKYYSALGLSDKEKRERLKHCSRHRATYVPPATPEHFWEMEFPDTQECKARGYLGDTQKVALKSRRRRPLK